MDQPFDRFRIEAGDRLAVLRRALDSARARDVGADDTVRRVARSLARTAESHGLSDLRRSAEKLADSNTRRQLFARARVFHEKVRAGPSGDLLARILVIEDEPTTALLLESVLSNEGWAVRSVGTIEEAEDLLREWQVDVILLDLLLPDADGRDYLLRLRERTATAGTPVIVISSRPESEARAECLALGAQDYLEKPIDPTRTIAAVADQLLQGARRRAESRPGGLVDRAALALAFDAQQARAAKGERGPLVVASIRLTLEPSHVGAGTPQEVPAGRSAAALIRDLLRPDDLLAEGRNGTLLALLPDTSPDDGVRLLEGAGAKGRCVTAGVSAVPEGGTLTEAITRAERLLALAQAPDMPRLLASEPTARDSGVRVLLVEDDPVTATLVTHRLKKQGYEVEHCADGLSALEAARTRSFTLGIFDVKIGGLDGFELLERVRALDHFKEVPIMMLTSMGRESDILRGFDLGADDYLLKPFSPVELMVRLDRLLDA